MPAGPTTIGCDRVVTCSLWRVSRAAHTVTTVRVRNGKASVIDGPLAKTKEQLTGLFFIDARDLNEAIQVASQMPQARRGPIEVRPMMEMKR